MLVNFLSAEVYAFISKAQTYENAGNILKSVYVKTPNEVFSRHKLYTWKQENGESLDEFMQALKVLSKSCNFRDVTSKKYHDEVIRDAFISG